MMPKDPLSRRLASRLDDDPRLRSSAEVIDLATRQVLPQVAVRRPRSEAAGIVAGVAVVAALGALTLWSLDRSRQPHVSGQAPAAAQIRVLPPQTITPASPAGSTTLPAQSAPASVLAAPPQTAMQPGQMLSPGQTIIFDASASQVPFAAPAGAPATGFGGPSPGGAAPQSGGNTNEDFASRLGGVGGGTATATASINPRTTVTQGTLIPAVLETAIDTDVPGYVRAVVSADVRSFDGSKVLVPRSSRLIGQYKSGMQAGQKRAYVIWTRLIRPDGVSVNIASPAIGFGGETGLAGQVSTHFFERFGSAMLLSVVGGLSALGGGGTAVVIGGGGQSAAAAAVNQTGQIGPTIRVRPGQPVRVFTARDLDFSKVAGE